MRLWGEELDALRIASGTIYNEIVIWKVVRQNCATSLEDHADPLNYLINNNQLRDQQYAAVHIHRLAGHEGSISRIAWSSDGSTLVSVSDDRSARIWTVCFKERSSNDPVEGSCESVGRVLFGHDARVWDCCIFDPLIITAGEDCTCRVWGLDSKQVKMIKEHIGRGIWRCLYDPFSSLLITAGFDSAIKVHQLYAPFRSFELQGEGVKEFIDKMEIFTACIPNSSAHARLMDSKSEYVRCLRFAYEDVFYVATNHGYLYHAKLSDSGSVKWTELVQVSKGVPIICMDLLFGNLSNFSSHFEDWISIGDGLGRVTIVTVGGDVSSPQVCLEFSWSAELKRRLLGTYWCKTLGHRYIFTADPRGMLKLWKLSDSILSASHNSVKSFSTSLIAEFESCFGMRIMCLNVSFDEELMVCGDLRGNMLLFPLLKSTLLGAPIASEFRIPPLNYFRGVHGISTVSSISIAGFNSDQIEICSTGGDGCVCYMEYDKDQQNLDFIGMKQVKELSLIESISTDANSVGDLASSNYAIGFASADFIIWNLTTETKVLQVSCGGWRRPHSYYLGDVAVMKNCFAYVKDEIIYIHRHWVPDSERKIFAHNLHMQFHGREMHCLRFVDRDPESGGDRFHNSRSVFISTGCEDGTVRLTRYTPDVENWSASKLLGEHVGGSAVRSICSVSKIHTVAANVTNMPNGSSRHVDASEDTENPFLLISVGAKRVLTSWILGNKRAGRKEALSDGPNNGTEDFCKPSSGDFSSMTFKWLSTDMPTNYSITKAESSEKIVGSAKKDVSMDPDASSGSPNLEGREMGLKTSQKDIYENDWRYLAVTAFLVKNASSRFSVCFVVVACSDATLALRALVLPCRFWFDVALLVPLSSPVLALQHAIIPIHLPSGDSTQIESAFIVISGSTDGSIAFWDLSVTIRTFMQQMSTFLVNKSFNCRKRPQTGRGSQGGRLWRSLSSSAFKSNAQGGGKTYGNIHNHVVSGSLSESNEPNNSVTAFPQNSNTSRLESEMNKNDFSSKICEIQPFNVQNNVHQSGVNCLHVSGVKNGQNLGFSSPHVVLSGGDDQSLCCIGFELALLPTAPDSDIKSPDVVDIAESEEMNSITHNCWGHKCRIRFLYCNSIASAHSSAVKGIWTDGKWVFSAGLDQRMRCWQLEDHGKLIERDHLIVSVPEPEALDARTCGCNHYQIAVAGRGMQMVEFSTCSYCDK